MRCWKKDTGCVINALRSAPILFFCIICILFLADTDPKLAIAYSDKLPAKRTTNAAGQPLRTKININKISAWYDADGTEEINSQTGNAGLIYPKGSANAVFTSGLMWGGEHHDGLDPLVRVGGHQYASGLLQGAILGVRTGVSEDPNAPDVRIWRVRRDFATADLTDDAADVNMVSADEVTEEQIEETREQYETDWLEWPAHKGAPFYDANENGIYEPMLSDGKPLLFPEADEPGMAGADQIIWYAANDLLQGSPWGATVSGIEVQQTIWAYNRDDGLGESVFKRYRVLYKGTAETAADAVIDSMYLAKWSDPDVGSFVDDFAGCDTILNLGYAYNAGPVDASFDQFGLPPPAIGYVLVQGPLVKGATGEDRNRNGIDDSTEVGTFDLQPTQPGFINLPMTAFTYCAAGGPHIDPCVGAPFNYSKALQWYCRMKGFPPTPQPPPCPQRPIDPATGLQATSFWLYGDPVTGLGWIDGIYDGPGDRRFLMSSGPFTLALGDTQEIVVAVSGGLGNDNLNSIERLKSNARLARVVHENLYDLPGPPAPPTVTAIGLDQKILLEWESDHESVSRTEDSVIAANYLFEGYNIYQFPDSTGDVDEATIIAQFDIVNGVKRITQLVQDTLTGEFFERNVQYGTDNGITRTFPVSVDSLRSSSPLVNGREYHFGVSAYNYTFDELLQIRAYESRPTLVMAQPETPKPGTRYPYSIQDTIRTVSQIVGNSDASLNPVVYNPLKQTGESYRLIFHTTPDEVPSWTLLKDRSFDTIYTDIGGFAPDSVYRVQDGGFDLHVLKPPTGVIAVEDQYGNDLFEKLILSPDSTLGGFNGRAPDTGEDYEIHFGEESFVVSAVSPFFFSQVIRVPFSVYEVGRGDPSLRKVMAAVRDSVGTTDTGLEWTVTPNGVRRGDTTLTVFEPIYGSSMSYVPDNPGTFVREDSLAVLDSLHELTVLTLNWDPARQAFHGALLVDTDGDSLPPASGIVRFRKYHEIRAGDQFRIEMEGVTTGDVDLAKGDIAAIKAFPNPYYGVNADETASSGSFITFNHLPAKAVIRIYSLAGIHVRKLEKDDPQTQYHRWDLRNENNSLVGSGIYLVYMELKDGSGVDLGTKILKLAIIQRER